MNTIQKFLEFGIFAILENMIKCTNSPPFSIKHVRFILEDAY